MMMFHLKSHTSASLWEMNAGHELIIQKEYWTIIWTTLRARKLLLLWDNWQLELCREILAT